MSRMDSIDSLTTQIDSVIGRTTLDQLSTDVRKLLFQLTKNIRYETQQVRETVQNYAESVGTQ